MDKNSPGYKQRFIDDDELKMNMGGKGAMAGGGYYVAGYDGADGSREGMEDNSQNSDQEIPI